MFNLISLTTKTGKVAGGEFSTGRTVEDETVRLVVVLEEVSDNTRRMFTNICTYCQVPIYFFGRKDELGHAMGREYRTSLAVLDSELGRAIVKQMDINRGGRYKSWRIRKGIRKIKQKGAGNITKKRL